MDTQDRGSAGQRQEAPADRDFRYDAFISYSSADRPTVRRIQHFLESYRVAGPDGKRRRVKVYLDATDIRGGALPAELGEALAGSRVLLLCCSAASAQSDWVRFEIRRYLEGRTDAVIVPLMLSGDPDRTLLPQLRAMPEFASAEPRVHDLRGGWWLGWLKPKAKEELLRVLALLTRVELRALRNWHRRRMATLVTAWSLGVLALPAAYLAWPVSVWDPVPLASRSGPALAPIACGVEGGQLWVSSLMREDAGDRPRHYLLTRRSALAGGRDSADARIVARERLLPLRSVDFQIQSKAAAAFGPALWSRLADFGGETVSPLTWLGEPVPGRFVALRKLPATSEQLEAAREFRDTHLIDRAVLTPALLAVHDGRTVKVAQVESMAPDWKLKRNALDDPASPADGVAVSWSDRSGLWLGVAGRRDGESGGLWHSTDAGAGWRRIEGLDSVRSVAPDPADPGRVLVTVAPFDHFVGTGRREQVPAAAWRVDARGERTAASDLPPFAAQSDVETCGTDLQHRRFARVDGRLFVQRQTPRLAALLQGRKG